MSTLRKTTEREQIEGAYSGATQDWAIVDVPPGTERVRMDGVSGGSEEITWPRYNVYGGADSSLRGYGRKPRRIW